jgi:hypothetical protein
VDSENTPSQHGSPMVENEQKNLITGNVQHYMCHDLSFGLMTKARARKSAGQKCNLGVTFTLPRM